MNKEIKSKICSFKKCIQNIFCYLLFFLFIFLSQTTAKENENSAEHNYNKDKSLSIINKSKTNPAGQIKDSKKKISAPAKDGGKKDSPQTNVRDKNNNPESRNPETENPPKNKQKPQKIPLNTKQEPEQDTYYRRRPRIFSEQDTAEKNSSNKKNRRNIEADDINFKTFLAGLKYSGYIGTLFSYSGSHIYRENTTGSTTLSSTSLSYGDFAFQYMQKISSFMLQAELSVGQILLAQSGEQNFCSLEKDSSCKRISVDFGIYYKIPLFKKLHIKNSRKHHFYLGLTYMFYRNSSLTLNKQVLFNSHFQAGFMNLSLMYMFRLTENIYPLVQIQGGLLTSFSQPALQKFSNKDLIEDNINYKGRTFAIKTGISYKL